MSASMDTSLQALLTARMQLQQVLSTKVDALERKAAGVKAQREEMEQYLGTIPKFLELNVGGDTEFMVSRDTFTRFPSRLAEMFSGRRDHLLPKDAEGRFFLDLDPHQMRAIINWLTELAAVAPGGTPPPHPRDALAPEHKWGIDELMEQLQLKVPDANTPGSAPTAAAGEQHWVGLEAAVAALPAEDRDVVEAAKDLARKARLCALEVAGAEAELAAVPHAADAGGDFVEQYCAAFKGEDALVALNVGGVHMTTARATLSAEEGSTLAAQFGPTGWPAQKAQSHKGRVVLQADPPSFACILQYLRLKRLGVERLGPLAQQPAYLLTLLDRLGLAAMKESLGWDSAILSRDQRQQVDAWLPPGARVEELLFRASRDGFEAAAFHARCDNRGATLVVALSAGGRRFGGFADKPWASAGGWVTCTGSFLFRLGGPTGEPPARCPLKPSQVQYGIQCNGNTGPMFGGGCDLYVQSGTGSCQCQLNNPGHTYELPVNGAGTLAEGSPVTLTNYEVFRIA